MITFNAQYYRSPWGHLQPEVCIFIVSDLKRRTWRIRTLCRTSLSFLRTVKFLSLGWAGSASLLQVRKEYRKFVRRHSWLPKCLRCSKTVTGGSAGSTGASGVAGGANGGKDFASHNTSSNPSAPTTDSSGLSPHAAANANHVGTNVGAMSPPNNHNNLTAACNNTNLSINVNLNNLSLRSPVGAHQMHMMAPSNHNRHPAQQGIQTPLIHQTKIRGTKRNGEVVPRNSSDRYFLWKLKFITFLNHVLTLADTASFCIFLGWFHERRLILNVINEISIGLSCKYVIIISL